MTKISTTKTIYFCIKWFHMTKEVEIRCCFALKTLTRTYTSSKRFLVSGFRAVFYVFKSHGLVQQGSYYVFCIFGSKWVENRFFSEKKQQPCFFQPTNWQILRSSIRYIFFFSQTIRADTKSSTLLT